jgi:tRNA pseudouridine55 synthase
MNGIFCVKKPFNMGSGDVVSHFRRLLGTKVVGHGGTLDPAAEGVLVIGVGLGCKHLHKDFLHDQKVLIS